MHVEFRDQNRIIFPVEVFYPRSIEVFVNHLESFLQNTVVIPERPRYHP